MCDSILSTYKWMLTTGSKLVISLFLDIAAGLQFVAFK